MAMISGRLGQEPKINQTQGGKNVASISVATSDKWKNAQGEVQEKTEWHRVTAFGMLADTIANHCFKGQLVTIIGKLQTRKYTDAQGVEKQITEIIIGNPYDGSKLDLLSWKEKNTTNTDYGVQDKTRSLSDLPPTAVTTSNNFNDDIPF
jgi:single-strand DNA-binding protein